MNKIVIFGKKIVKNSHFLTIFGEKYHFLLKNLKKWTFFERKKNLLRDDISKSRSVSHICRKDFEERFEPEAIQVDANGGHFE